MRRIDSCTDRSTCNLIATVLAVVVLAQPAVADTLLYETRIATPSAQVRSGPAEKFYPTDTLAQGDTVEVYREEPGGWLAIRPPKDSFSWISARDLKFRTGSLAEVARDGVASRIGSRLSDNRNAAQVRLKKGEVVEIIGEQSSGWYKIAPPAGEFRWIHATNVEPANRQQDVPTAESTAAASAPAPQSPAEQPVVAASATNDTTSEAVSIPAETKPPAAESISEPGNSWRAAPQENSSDSAPPEIAPLSLAAPQSTATPSPPPSAAPQPESASLPPPPETPPEANSTTAPPTNETAESPPPAASPPPADALELTRQLTDIELRLSRMAVAPPHLWNTELMERDAEQLLDQAQTTAERDAVKVTLGKIDRFRALSRQYQQAASIAPQPGSPDAARYDAVGILRPVVSKRPGAPQFAIVDDQGQVVSFVTPTPDVNLQTFVGTRVGITGNRGFIPEFNRAHVTAGRVTPLNERVIR